MSKTRMRSNGLTRKISLFFFTLAIIVGSSFLNGNNTNSIYAAEPGIYYVSTAGDDNNPGTLTSPWRTIQKAANTLLPGNTVYVRGGTYSEYVSFKRSGTQEGGYITFQNYSNEIPVIDGTGKDVTSANQALLYLSNVSYVRIKGFEIRNLVTTSQSRDPAGIRVRGIGSYIQLLNNNVHHIENRATEGNAHGIHVLGSSIQPMTQIDIQDNEVHDLITGSSESVTLSGNVDGFTIMRNHIYENNNIGIDVAGFYGACSNPCVDQTRNGVISGNTVHHIDTSDNPAYRKGSHIAAGIYADGATKVLIERNHLYSNDFGISLASEAQGRSTSDIRVQNNYIHHNYGAGLIMGGSGPGNGGTSSNVILNNTFVENDSLRQGYGEITLQWNNVNNQFMNNIMYSNSQKVLLNKVNSSGSGNIFDYNLMYNMDGTSGAKWGWNGTSYSTWATYKKASGNDSHSMYSDPLFIDKLQHNIQVKTGSNAIDKGSSQNVDVRSYDYNGLARIQGESVDIGATEHVPSPLDDNPQPPQITAMDDAYWSEVATLSSGTGHARILKATKDSSNLNIYVAGSSLTSKGQIFINTDNNTKTGFAAPYWKTSGADYLLENGTLYRYTGTGGSNWKWTQVKNDKGAQNYIVSSTVFKILIPLVDLGTKQANVIKIGYVWNDSNSDKLPGSGDLLIVKDAAVTTLKK
ncbi:choice-of-anchor Q domain-containing protein [Paenibacillus sp. FA6]|uniref:choice-of-anchor Q domain-containing protein n=1 Tax=Paenibacillus sp. FA6 TaxID=3413029 RepID=UPI003F65E91A